MWVSHAERPLHVDELCHALGVEDGSIDLNIQNIPAIETLLACSLGLVTVEKSSSTIRLVHYTLQEFLSHSPNLFVKPNSMIAEVCLTYLNFRYIRGLSPTVYSAPPAIPFLTYASCYWGAHARRETTESVKTLALQLLSAYENHVSSKMLLLHEIRVSDQPLDPEDTPEGFTGLHCAAYFGCTEIVVALLETNRWDVQATDFSGNTAIAWAARRGHEGVVRAFLERKDIEPAKADKRNRTPLSWALDNGHEGIVQLLQQPNFVPKHAADLQSIKLFSVPSELSDPLPAGSAGFSIQGQNPALPSPSTERTLSAGEQTNRSKILRPLPRVLCTWIGKLLQMSSLWITCLECLVVSLAPPNIPNLFPFLITIIFSFYLANFFSTRAPWCVSILPSLYSYALLIFLLSLIPTGRAYSLSANH